MNRFRILSFSLLLLATLSGCGVKGPLTLPPPDAPAPQSTTP